MAACLSSSPLSAVARPAVSQQRTTYFVRNPTTVALRSPVQIKLRTAAIKRLSHLTSSFKTISCSIAQPETLQIVQSTIAKQLSIDESTVTPETKFADLGADSLDTVEIMMALEEKFGVSIGEEGAASISTVQEAADAIEKVKAGST